MSDLAFYTSDELVEELMNRKTFLGLVIRAEEELTISDELPSSFQMHCRNVTPEQAVGILKHLSESLEEDIDNGGGPEWQCEE